MLGCRGVTSTVTRQAARTAPRQAARTEPFDWRPMSENEREYWERYAKSYDRSMIVFGKPIAPMLERVANAVRGRERVLELAAGTGLVTGAIAKSARAVVATDYAQAMVDALAARVRDGQLDNVRCERADVYSLPYEAGTFDAVVAANVLHLLPDLPRALDAMKRVVRPGGVWVLPTYCHDETALSWTLSRFLAITGFPGQRRFTLPRLRDALESAGLGVARIERLAGPIPIGYAEGTFGETPRPGA